MPPFRFLPVEWRDALPSTNTALIERVRRDLNTPSGVVLAARAQTAGRGRQQRRWNTAPGRNLTFSFLWNTPVPPDTAPALALAIATGVARMLEAEGLAPTIKWPNDVQVSGRKIAGILCESAGGAALVAGIGLNVNMDAAEAAEIDQPATSLALETGRSFVLEHVLTSLLQHLGPAIDAWAAHGFPGFREGYLRFAPNAGSVLRVRDGEAYVEGVLAGFNDHGALRLRLPGGEIRECYSGDVQM